LQERSRNVMFNENVEMLGRVRKERTSGDKNIIKYVAARNGFVDDFNSRRVKERHEMTSSPSNPWPNEIISVEARRTERRPTTKSTWAAGATEASMDWHQHFTSWGETPSDESTRIN
jgi:hypothetical protein